MLRQLSRQARDGARAQDEAPRDPLVRARRAVGLLLPRRRVRRGAARVPGRGGGSALRSAQVKKRALGFGLWALGFPDPERERSCPFLATGGRSPSARS